MPLASVCLAVDGCGPHTAWSRWSSPRVIPCHTNPRRDQVTGNEKWKGLTWGMLPLHASGLAACTYHFFFNPCATPIAHHRVARAAYSAAVAARTAAMARANARGRRSEAKASAPWAPRGAAT